VGAQEQYLGLAHCTTSVYMCHAASELKTG
jgi:hypothetical protein